MPVNYSRFGRLMHSQAIRYYVCKRIFKSIGGGVNIEKESRVCIIVLEIWTD